MIGEAAKLVGVTSKTVRHREKIKRARYPATRPSRTSCLMTL